jgi:outer membrane protein TolC
VTVEPITIPVLDAIRRALDHNLAVLTAEDNLGRSEGARRRALSDRLPNIDAHITETRQKLNLAAFGFGTFQNQQVTGFPSIVGPFNVFDARVNVSQSIFDLHAINNTRAEDHNLEASRLTRRSARDLVIHVTGNSYIYALAAAARAESARAQRDTAQAIYNTSVDLKSSGIVAGIDVLRAQVQLSTETQRLTAASNDAEKAKLQLARIIGLPLGQPFRLDARLPDLPEPDVTLEQAVEQAYRQRSDYQAALERVKAAEAARQAVIGEGRPSVHVNADYGEIGLTVPSARSTFAVVGAVNIPIFQGGRQQGRLLEADADLRTRRAQAEDTKASIYYEVRTAFLDLQASSEQLRTATQARDLAGQQLTQARDRFAAGVANNIEVVQAQEAVALANEQFINATFGYDLAKGALIRGTGTTEQFLRQILGGTR